MLNNKLKIIILAAGKGERLMPLTMNTPKPLLDMGNGRTLLEEQIDRIVTSGVIDKIVLVIGYLAEQVEAKIRMYIDNNLNIKTIYNPFYDASNNLISLWFSKYEMDSDFLVTNGDNIFSPDVFTDFVKKNGDGIYLSINVKEKYDFDDMKVTVENTIVTRVSKLIDAEKSNAESPGLALVRGSKARKLFLENLELLVRDKKNINMFWLEVFNAMHDKGIPIYTWEFDGKTKWQEVDYHIDFNKAKDLLQIRNL